MTPTSQPRAPAISFIERDMARARSGRSLQIALPVLLLIAPAVMGLELRDDTVGVIHPSASFQALALNFGMTVALAIIAYLGLKRFSHRPLQNSIVFALLGVGLVAAMRRVLFESVPTTYASDPIFWHENLKCLIKGTTSALLLGAIITALLFRFQAWPTSRWRSIFAVISALTGTAMLTFHCDSSSFSHVAISHFGFVIGVTVLILMAERWIVRRSMRRVLGPAANRLNNLAQIG